MGRSHLRLAGVVAAGFLLMLASPILLSAASQESLEQEVDGYHVSLAFAVGKAQIGHNELIVKITDARDQPVANAQVTITAELHEAQTMTTGGGHSAHGGGGTQVVKDVVVRSATAEFTAGHEAGEYEGEIELAEAGHWMIEVAFVIDEQEMAVEFPVDVGKEASKLGVLAAFLGINAAFITGGALTRKKFTAKRIKNNQPGAAL